MFEHVTIRARDRAASAAFYATVLAALGLERTGAARWQEFRLEQATAQRPPTQGLHIAFAATSHEEIEAFWHAGTAAGYRDDGPPGPRPQYSEDYYGAFLLDPDGNSAEAARHANTGPPGVIDHLWIRVGDVARARAFYADIAPRAGLRHGTDLPERAQFRSSGCSFSFVDGPPATEHLHLAFPADEDAILIDPDGNTVELVRRIGA